MVAGTVGPRQHYAPALGQPSRSWRTCSPGHPCPRPGRLEQARQELLDALGDGEGPVDRGGLKLKLEATLVLCLWFAGFASVAKTVIGWMHV